MLWIKPFWAHYSEYKPDFVDYSLQIIKTHIFIDLTHSYDSLREENKHRFE